MQAHTLHANPSFGKLRSGLLDQLCRHPLKIKSASPHDVLTGRELARNLRTDTRSLHGPAHRSCVDRQPGTSLHIRNQKGRLLASFAGCRSSARFLKDSSNTHVTLLERKFVAGNVRKHRHNLSKCAASEEETKLVSVEGSALTEEGKEKEKVITEGWLDGNSFQVWQQSVGAREQREPTLGPL